MKRTILVLLTLLVTAGFCMAQTIGEYFARSGLATQELQADGLTAAHPTFPIGTKVRITNVSNGADIEATIIRQIPLSGERIIDLSPGSAYGLGFRAGEGGPVVITTYTLPSWTGQPSSPAPVPPETAAIKPPDPLENPGNPPDNSSHINNNSSTHIRTQIDKETVERTEKTSLPFDITINNYLTNTNTSPQERQQERPGPRDRDAKPRPPDIPSPPVYQPPPETPVYEPPPLTPEPPMAYQPVPSPLITAPPIADVQIIPALPNPRSDKTYRLLVGNYNNMENASLTQQQLQAVGFDVEQEQLGDWYKVYASGIPAASVFYAAKRLGAIGFAQVWVYE